MAAPKENRLFPPQPYYIPGYKGFVPQYKYRFGESFGKTTHALLTDPTVYKSPRSLLAPWPKQKIDEESNGMKHRVHGYVPVHPGYFPYEKDVAATNFPDPILDPRPPTPGPGLAEDDLMMMDTDPMLWHHPGEYVPRPRLPRGYIQRISHHPASEEQEWRLPEITPSCGQGRSYGPIQLCGSPIILGRKRTGEWFWVEKTYDLSKAAKGGSGLYWCSFYFCLYFKPVRSEGVTLPGVEEITDVKHKWLPNLDIPNAIQQKVIPGYSGYIPRLIWINGMNYNRSVKEAMKEFDEYQRNPVCRLGNRYPQTYWPNNQIYTSAGLIPGYAGFVPNLRDTYSLAFGNSTRKAYKKE
ncbi:protein FAM166A [Cuculus canorus]|uniref:protein FAM166A n=1 Tax=Cuculus canorus TaxID=55661 RepID=UPI0023AA9EB7|nr:protein FAM166A [Cuculus canorus]